MGIMKRLSFDWDKLAAIILNNINGRFSREDLQTKESQDAFLDITLGRLAVINSSLPWNNNDKYRDWILRESYRIAEGASEIISGTENKTFSGVDTRYFARAIMMAAVLDYVRQFYTYDGIDSEFFYLLYKRVLQKEALSLLTVV